MSANSKAAPTPGPTAKVKEGRLKCSYCGTIYLLGDPTPNMQLPYYPDGERRYWGHCLTEDHIKVMRVRDASQRQMLEALPTVLPEAKRAQKIQQHPVFRALKEVIG